MRHHAGCNKGHSEKCRRLAKQELARKTDPYCSVLLDKQLVQEHERNQLRFHHMDMVEPQAPQKVHPNLEQAPAGPVAPYCCTLGRKMQRQWPGGPGRGKISSSYTLLPGPSDLGVVGLHLCTIFSCVDYGWLAQPFRMFHLTPFSKNGPVTVLFG